MLKNEFIPHEMPVLKNQLISVDSKPSVELQNIEYDIETGLKDSYKIMNRVNEFKDIDEFKNKYEFDYIYTQKGGKKDNWKLKNFKLLVHSVYPQALSEIHGHRYVYISEWLEKEFTNYKIKSVPYIVELDKTKKN